MLPAQPNLSLIDGIAVLLAVAGADAAVGSREVARQLGLEPTRANRLLRTLADLGLTRQDASRKYTSGPGMHVLSAMSLFGSGLIRRSLPALESLHALGAIVALGVLWRDRVAYLYHALPGMPQAEALGRAKLFPATRSSIGLALLAQKPWTNVKQQYAGRKPEGFDSFAELKDALGDVRRNGFASVLTDDARTSLAVPLAEPGLEPYAAVAVSGHFSPGQTRTAIAALQQAKQTIEKEMKP